MVNTTRIVAPTEDIPVTLTVSRHKGELELGKRRAAGWPPIQAPQMEVKGGRILFFADPGSEFRLAYGRVAPGLRLSVREMPVDVLDQFGSCQLPPMPIWLVRLSSRHSEMDILSEMAAACLDLLEEGAVASGDMPEYLRE